MEFRFVLFKHATSSNKDCRLNSWQKCCLVFDVIFALHFGNHWLLTFDATFFLNCTKWACIYFIMYLFLVDTPGTWNAFVSLYVLWFKKKTIKRTSKMNLCLTHSHALSLLQIRPVLRSRPVLPLQHVQPSLLWGGGKGFRSFSCSAASVSDWCSRVSCQASSAVLSGFLREQDQEKVVMVADPPFGGLVKPLASSFSLISQRWRQLQSSGQNWRQLSSLGLVQKAQTNLKK